MILLALTLLFSPMTSQGAKDPYAVLGLHAPRNREELSKMSDEVVSAAFQKALQMTLREPNLFDDLYDAFQEIKNEEQRLSSFSSEPPRAESQAPMAPKKPQTLSEAFGIDSSIEKMDPDDVDEAFEETDKNSKISIFRKNGIEGRLSIEGENLIWKWALPALDEVKFETFTSPLFISEFPKVRKYRRWILHWISNDPFISNFEEEARMELASLENIAIKEGLKPRTIAYTQRVVLALSEWKDQALKPYYAGKGGFNDFLPLSERNNTWGLAEDTPPFELYVDKARLRIVMANIIAEVVFKNFDLNDVSTLGGARSSYDSSLSWNKDLFETGVFNESFQQMILPARTESQFYIQLSNVIHLATSGQPYFIGYTPGYDLFSLIERSEYFKLNQKALKNPFRVYQAFLQWSALNQSKYNEPMIWELFRQSQAQNLWASIRPEILERIKKWEVDYIQMGMSYTALIRNGTPYERNEYYPEFYKKMVKKTYPTLLSSQTGLKNSLRRRICNFLARGLGR